LSSQRRCRERDGEFTHPRIEAGKFETPAVDRDERAELTVGIGGIWSRRAGRFELCRALTLAKAAPPHKVGRVVLASADWMLFLESVIAIKNGASWSNAGGGRTYDAIEGYDLRVGFIAAGAFHLGARIEQRW
jgi:hypothetical protein